MPLDEEARRELDAVRAELADALEELRRRPSADSSGAVREAKLDLDDALRREGYRLSRRELDELVRARDDAALEAKLAAMLDAREAAAREAAEQEEEEEEEEDGGEPAGKKTKRKKSGDGDGDEEKEWT